MQFDTNKTGTAYPSESPEFIPVYFYFYGVHVAQSVDFCVMFCK